MILHKNRLIFGVIRRIINTVFKFCYKIIKAFNLHLTLFVFLLGIILAIIGVIGKDSAGLVVYLIVLASTVVYALVKTLKNIFGVKSKNNRVKIVKVQDNTDNQPEEQTENQEIENTNEKQSYIPKYFTVKNNPSYVYAEYEDRYELFLKTSNGLKKVRVDYK